jgi:Oxidoreductase family, NAD-binding Rossmann fold
MGKSMITNVAGIGLVDLDTSHPQAWLPILRDLGYTVAGVYDGGTVYPAGYARDFARETGIPLVFDSVEEMAAHPDIHIAIVHSCDWDLHVGRTAPFAAQGKAVLVDKPIAGRLDDLNQFRMWNSAGTRIAGGSSLRYAPEVLAFNAHVERQGKPRALLVGCGVDEFNYGIHAFSMVVGMLGSGIEAARHVGFQQGLQQVELTWQDGGKATLLIGGEAWLPFFATAVHAQSVEHVQASPDTLYRALLEHVMPYLSRAVDTPPTPYEQLIEPELAALAAQISYRRNGAWIRLDDAGITEAHYDGAAFGRGYRASKLGVKA